MFSHLCMLNIGQGLPSKLFVMSHIMLVGPPLKSRFSVKTETPSAINVKTVSLCQTQRIHHSAQ